MVTLAYELHYLPSLYKCGLAAYFKENLVLSVTYDIHRSLMLSQSCKVHDFKYCLIYEFIFLVYVCYVILDVLNDVSYVGCVLHTYEYQYLAVNVDFVGSDAVCDFYICYEISVPEAIGYL